MNSLAIVGRDFHPDGKETAALLSDSLKEPLKDHGFDSVFVKISDLLFDVSNDNISVIDSKTGRALDSFGAVLMTNWFSHASVRKDVAYALSLFLNSKNVPFLNTEAMYSRSTSKLSQMMLAALNDVPVARSVFCLDLKATQKYLSEISFPVPFILKNMHASRGKGNYLLDRINDIPNHSSEHSEKSPFVAQQFIDSDHTDYRLFMVASKVKLVIKRSGKSDSHLNNTSAGASTDLVLPYSFSKEAISIAEKMSKLLHRELTGLDIIFNADNQKPYFLEANPIPQIATGSNTEAKISALAEGLVSMAKDRKA